MEVVHWYYLLHNSAFCCFMNTLKITSPQHGLHPLASAEKHITNCQITNYSSHYLMH